jgi:hypothetical protein
LFFRSCGIINRDCASLTDSGENQTAMTASEKTEMAILAGNVEYTVVFTRPIIEALIPAGPTFASLLDILEPWGFDFEGVETTNTTKLSEVAFTFRSSHGVVITLGLGKVVISAQNLDRKNLEQFKAGASAFLKFIFQVGRTQTKVQKLSWGNHLQLKARTPKEVMTPLFNKEFSIY